MSSESNLDSNAFMVSTILDKSKIQHLKIAKKSLGDSKEDLRLVIKEYKELENIGT